METRTMDAIRAYADMFIVPHLSNSSLSQYAIAIHADGLASPEAGRVVFESGRVSLQENRGGRYRVIAVFKPGQKSSIRDVPDQTFVDALEYRVLERQVSEIDREEFGQEMAKTLREYKPDTTPVITVVDVTSLQSTNNQTSPYDDALRTKYSGVRETPLKKLATLVPKGYYVEYPGNPSEVTDGPFLSANGLVSAHADNEGVYVVEKGLSELLEQLSQSKGWRVDNRKRLNGAKQLL